MSDQQVACLPSVQNDLAQIERISAVPKILQIVCETTGLGFAAVARVTETSWVACAVLDRIGFGLLPGGSLPVATTFCHEIQGHREPVIIEKASEDPLYCRHPTPTLYGFESYIAVPIILRSGEVFGTICALDPKPVALRQPGLLPSLTMFAELIAAQLEIENRLAVSQSALRSANETAVLREQFIAILGHDLRNPIASIGSGLRQLSQATLPDKATAYISHMRQSCGRMAELVDNMLDFARARMGGGIQAERHSVPQLGAVLMQIVDECQEAQGHRRIETRIDLPEPVFCDPQRVAQVLSNLLTNAFHHGAPDQPVRVQASSVAGGLRMQVTNHGPAIPAGKLEQLFQPFSRGSDSGGAQEGLGLGLYIAAQIARSHEGRLQVSSTEAETTFLLELPGNQDRRPQA